MVLASPTRIDAGQTEICTAVKSRRLLNPPAAMAGEAAKDAAIGKVVLGGTLARIGVASAGAAIGIPVLAAVALVGGAVATAAYAAYKIGRGKRDHERAESLLARLVEHMRGLSPSGEWSEIEMYVSAPGSGLTAMWQPEPGDEVCKSAE